MTTANLSDKALEKFAAISKRDPRSIGDAHNMSARSLERRAFSTGLAGVDRVIGDWGGVPRGRFSQFYGESASGKSTLAYHVIAEAQKTTRAVLIDYEYTFEEEYARALGVDTDALTLIQPLTAEEGVEAMQDLAQVTDWGLIVVDSVGAMNPAKLYEYEVNKSLPAARARLIKDMFMRLNPLIARNEIAWLGINHLASTLKLDGGGNPIMIPSGGQAMKYYCTLNVKLFKSARPNTEDGTKDSDAVSSNVTATIEKNKLGRSYRKAELELEFMKGFDRVKDLIATAKDLGVIEMTGSNFNIDGKKINGKEKFSDFLWSHPAITRKLYADTILAVRAEALAERKAAIASRMTVNELFAAD